MVDIEDHKVALITGSSSGIGASAAKLFAQRGFKVVVTGLEAELIAEVVAECDKLSPPGVQAFGVVADLSDLDEAENLVLKTIERFGKLDVLVNNAGVWTKTHAAQVTSFSTYRSTMAINCDSVVKITLAAVSHLEKTNGNIVFTSSIASTRPSSSSYAYRMSKAAITAFAKSLAVDVAPIIRVNIVSPGPVSTPLFQKAGISDEDLRRKSGQKTLLGRVGETEEIAKAIFYLASEEASFVNGAELFVDGGYLCKPPAGG